MTCLISVGKSGKYCCIEAPHSKGELQHIDLNEGALIFKSANLPPTPLLCQVDKEWVDSGIVVGGDTPCVTVCKPGCYKLPIDCADYEGVEAPAEGAVELCYECDPEFDKLAWALTEGAAGGAAADAEVLVALEALCAKLEALIAVSNDATALAAILASLQAVCDKLLDLAAQNEALCEKLLDVSATLETLCEKIEAGDAAVLACLEEMKTALAEVTSLLADVCAKFDTANESLAAICDKLDAMLALLTAQLAALLAALVAIEANQTGMSCDTPTFIELCGYDPIECCKAPSEGLAVDAWCQAYAPNFPIGDGAENCEYALSVDGVFYDLPNPYTQADVEAVLATAPGDYQIIDGFLCRTDGPGRVAWRKCTGGTCDGKVCTLACSLATTIQQFVEAAEPTCYDALPVRTCFEEPIANDVATLVEQGNEQTLKLCQLADLIKEVPNACAESAVIGWCGRPANEAEYAYGDITASTLEEFNAAWEASGGKTWIAAEDGVTGGECHWFCPAIPGAVFTINGVEPVNGNVVASPNPNAEALGCVPTDALATCDLTVQDLLSQLLAKQCESNEMQELANAKLCLIENNTNKDAPCSEPVEGLDKEALTLTIAGDVVANYAEGQPIDLQNANAESCGSATSAGGATYDAGTDLTTIPIVECELDEGKEPVVIVKAQAVKSVTLQAIKTVKTLTAVSTLVKEPVIVKGGVL